MASIEVSPTGSSTGRPVDELGRPLAQTRSLDVLVIYEHSMLWDVLKSVLGQVPGIGLAAIERSKLSPKLLTNLRFDVVILDSDVLQVDNPLVGTLCATLLTALSRPAADDLSGAMAESGPAEPTGEHRRRLKLIVMGLLDNDLVIIEGVGVSNADAGRLVEALRS